MPLVSAGSQREPDLIQTPMATERRCSMRSVSTIRPFGNTVRRRFRSFVVIISSNSIVGQLAPTSTLLVVRLPRFRFIHRRNSIRICPAHCESATKCSMLNPSVTQKSSQFVQLDAAKPEGEVPAFSGRVRKNLFGLDAEALAALAVAAGEPGWRGDQLAEAIYRQRNADLNEITTLPKSMRGKLADEGWEVGCPRIAQVFQSVDGTERYLVQCQGDNIAASAETVETVWMPEGDDGEAGDGSDSSGQAGEGTVA